MPMYERILGFFEQYNMIKTFLLILVLTLLCLFLLGWPGCILAAAVGGFFTRGLARAVLVGFLAGFLAWLIPLSLLIPLGGLAVLELFGAIAGLEGLGIVLVVIILLIGGLLGLVGSFLGNSIFTLLVPTDASSTDTPPPS